MYQVSATKESFITMKDHKPDFLNNPTYRLRSPSKSEIRMLRKKTLDEINKKVIQATNLNLWKSTSNALEWFKTIPTKVQHAFITFDVWLLPIHLRATPHESARLCIPINQGYSTRSPHYHSLKKINHIPPELTMAKTECWYVWCDDGFIRRRWILRTSWCIHHRQQCYCLWRHVLAVLKFARPGIRDYQVENWSTMIG